MPKGSWCYVRVSFVVVSGRDMAILAGHRTGRINRGVLKSHYYHCLLLPTAHSKLRALLNEQAPGNWLLPVPVTEKTLGSTFAMKPRVYMAA